MGQSKFRVLLLDTKYRNPNHYICLAIYRALQRHPEIEFVAKADPVDAASIATHQRCNLFIAFDGEELRKDLCTALSMICGRSILWVTEDPYELPVNLRNAELFDIVFTNDSSSVAAYGNRGHHLPLAGSLEFHSLPVRPHEQSLRYQMFFAGTAWPNRSQFLRSVLKRIPSDWKCKLALPTNQFLPPHGIDLPPSSLAWRTSPVDFARFANQSTATLMLPRVFSTSGGRALAETPPPRLFEGALAGSVQMIHESLSEATQFFAADKEIVLFSDEDDFIHKAKRLVEDREYRDEIAQAARTKALDQHTYDRRVDTILSSASKIEAKPQPSGTGHRRTILFVTHNVIGAEHFGGVEVYLDHLRKALRSDYRVLFYVPDTVGARRSVRLLSENYEVLETLNFARRYTADLLRCDEREDAFLKMLGKYQIDLVHFHHFIGHPPSIALAPRLLGISTAFTAHDFYGACHEFNLLSFKEVFCGAPEVTLSQCDVCLWQKHRIAPGSQALRRNFWNDILGRINLLAFNTRSSKMTYERIYPSVRSHDNIRILPVPVPDGPIAPLRTGKNAALKVAWLGNVTRQKGGHVLMRALPLLAHAPVEFHLFGRIDSQYAGLADRTRFPNVVVHGGYNHDAVPSMLKECDVSLHLSIWPETYCLTLSEALQSGLVPIVTDIGALGERITHQVDGIKIQPDSEGELVDAIRLLADSPDIRERLRAHISPHLYAQLGDHIASLKDAYLQAMRGRPLEIPSIEAGLNSSEIGLVPHPQSWHKGTSHLPLIGKSLSGSTRKAYRLAAFYKTHGLQATLRIISNRIRAAR